MKNSSLDTETTPRAGGEIKIISRTTRHPVHSIKGKRPQDG
jgi:hypothetical protein